MEKYNPDKEKDLRDSSLIQISKDLLMAIIGSTNMLSVEDMSPEKLKEAKIVLGYLNAANNSLKTKMQVFKLIGIEEKIDAIEKQASLLR